MFSKKMLEENSYELNHDNYLIACVGTNGGTTDEAIREGFKETVQLILELMYKKESKIDYMIYPFLYNAQHSVELGLKIIIRLIHQIYEIKQDNICGQKIRDQKILSKHDCNLLNTFIIDIYHIDNRIPPEYNQIQDFMEDYFMDTNGDFFRYTYDLQGKPHFEDNHITHISIDTFFAKFTVLSKKIDEIIILLESLCEEYKTKTFTKNLSRAQIEEISKELLDYSEWKEDKFNANKQNLRDKYNISNNELCEVINLIKDNREFCTNIGLEIPFGNLSYEALSLLSKFIQLKDNEKEKVEEITATSLIEKFIESPSFKIEHEIEWEKITEKEIRTCLIFEQFAKHCQYSEEVEIIKQYFDTLSIERESAYRKIKAQIYFIIEGMKLLGQKTYLEKIEQIRKQNNTENANEIVSQTDEEK